jgi:heme A synthase
MSEMAAPSGGAKPPGRFNFSFKWDGPLETAHRLFASFGGLSAITLVIIAAITHSSRTGYEYAIECGAYVCVLLVFAYTRRLKGPTNKEE